MIKGTEEMVSHENLNLLQDEEYRHFCRESYFQRGDKYKIMQIKNAERNEFILIQAAKANTDCKQVILPLEAQLLYPSRSHVTSTHPKVACSKLLRQANYFRVWYHSGGILRKKPYDDSEGLRYVQILPEPKCGHPIDELGGEKGEQNRSSAFIHFTMLRMRLPVTNNTEEIWKRIGAATDMQQPKFRSLTTLNNYQKSVFVPDSFIGKHSPTVPPCNVALLTVISFITLLVF
uniref:Uncharacterized protein n=1 Tax=Setaria digitata TaxID=48799 RepID=A0A915Q0R0_9BILA